MPSEIKETEQAAQNPDYVEVRWSIPKNVLDGIRAAHLVHGDASFMDYVAKALTAYTPKAFRK